MNCPTCTKPMTGIEYYYAHPDHYDGVSEWDCWNCCVRIGRWSGRRLAEGESEPMYGERKEERETEQKD